MYVCIGQDEVGWGAGRHIQMILFVNFVPKQILWVFFEIAIDTEICFGKELNRSYVFMQK